MFRRRNHAGPGGTAPSAASGWQRVPASGFPAAPVATMPPGTVPGESGAQEPGIGARVRRTHIAGARSAAKKLRHQGRHGLRMWLLLLILPPVPFAVHQWWPKYAWLAVAGFAVIGWWRRGKIRGKLTARKLNRKKDKAFFTYADVCVAAAVAWLAWAVLAGPALYPLLALMIGWGVLAFLWWDYHRRLPPPAEPVKEDPPPVREPDQLLTRLQTRVCAPGGPVGGGTVTELPPIQGGRVFQFTGIPGTHTAASVTSAAATARIASAAEAPEARVVTEPEPGIMPGEHGPAHMARVTVLEPQHLHREIQEFTGPTLDKGTGLIVVGPYLDGQPAHKRLYKVDEHGIPFRAASGLNAGASGSGKSRHGEHHLLECLASGMFQTVLIDGHRGASIGDLTDYVGWAALQELEWELAFRALWRLGTARLDLIASKRLGHWDLDLGPFVHTQVEEAHVVLRNPVCLRAAKILYQESEKIGIGIETSTQFPSQVELGGNSGAQGANVLREMAAAGNVTLHRTGGNFAANVLVGNISVNTRDLPSDQPGSCYVFGASMRQSRVRGIRATAPASWDRLFNAMPFSKLDIAALDGGGDVYTQRLARLAEHVTEPDPERLDYAALEAMILDGAAAPVPGRAAEAGRKADVRQTVWEIVSELGPVKREDILKEVEKRGVTCTPGAVDQHLAQLKRLGGLRSGEGHGMWEKAPLHSVTATA